MTTNAEPLQETLNSIKELVARNRFDHARSLIESARQENPDDEQLLYYAGYIAWREDELDEASEFAQRLLELDPDSYSGRHLMADIRFEQEQYSEAEAIYIELLTDYPEDSDSYAGYSLVMIRTLHVEKAEKLAGEALRFEPENPVALRVSILASLVKGDRREQDHQLSELIRSDPGSAATAYSMIHVLHEKGENRAALRVSQELLAVNPTDENLVEIITELKTHTHWSMLPMWPMMRFGWAASIAIWFAAVAGFRLLPDGSLKTTLLVAFLIFVVYSWVWPRVLPKLIRR